VEKKNKALLAEDVFLIEEGAKSYLSVSGSTKIHPRDSRSEPEAQLGTLLRNLESYTNTRRFEGTFDESAISLS